MNSILSYIGGKNLLTQKIIPHFPEHQTYCEVFAGAAWMLFRKEQSKVEIINDINSDLVTLYRVIKLHLEEFIRYFKWLLVSRDEFERFKKENPECLTDIQRAVRFYYLLRCNYGSKPASHYFSVSPARPPRLNLLRLEEDLSAAHIRLSRVFIENLPYQTIIERHDRVDTFFYLDPPYYDCEDYYGKGLFAKADFQRLADMLSNIKGKFAMSINDVPEIRKMFKAFKVTEVATTYSVSNTKKSKVVELLIMNY